ncbi:hypothetical protein WI560_15445 [Bradyrhizobium sp. A11]|uniref:hypothetical protein n=1 Tax=Bradyrhizobium sp. A11 TaxID=3133974 RepID=UPI003251EFF9
MSEAIDQAEVGSVSESNGAAESATPLASILDHRDTSEAPASEQSNSRAEDGDVPNVPLTALRAERERRRKMDARVRELEDELQKYNEEKWGYYDEADEGASQTSQQNDANQDPAVERYNQSFTSFTSKHGKATVDAIDAALKQLTPAQKQEVLSMVGSTTDPVESIYGYVKRIGLLDGAKPLSIKDILASKGKVPPSAEDGDAERRLSEMTQREQAVHAAELRAIQAASRSEFIAEHGVDTFKQLDAVVGHLMQNQHPAVEQLKVIYQSSPRPAHAVAEALYQWGMLEGPSAHQQAQPQRQPSPQVFPSNFANVRNVGVRNGPAWAGPAPLQDIFKRGRA